MSVWAWSKDFFQDIILLVVNNNIHLNSVYLQARYNSVGYTARNIREDITSSLVIILFYKYDIWKNNTIFTQGSQSPQEILA